MTRYIPLMLLFVAACGPKDESISIKGDVPDLERMAKRGDSLVAHATSPILVDSLRFPPAVDSNSPVTAGARTETAGRLDSSAGEARGVSDNPIARRAQALGDSLARADARSRYGNVETTSRARRDTIRGIVTLTGPGAAPQAALRDANGTTVTLTGMATSDLTRMEGAEVLVRGVKLTPRSVVVTDYIVRAVDGVPAWDGRLEQVSGGWSLDLTDGSGRKRVGTVPAALRSLAGTRVWVSMRSGDATHAFGAIGRR